MAKYNEYKRKLEEEIETKRLDTMRSQDEFEKTLDDRKKKIQEEIELEKKLLYQEPVHQARMAAVKTGSQFESRLSYRRASTSALRGDSKLLYTNNNVSRNSIEIPRSNLSLSNNDRDYGNIIIINKE